MTTQVPVSGSLENLARGAFEALGRHDLSGAEQIWAEDAVDQFPTGEAVGREQIVAFFERMFAAFPDLTIEVEHVVESDPYVVVQWRAAGTFTGARFEGVRATGRRVAFRGCDVILLSGERLVQRNTIYWDGAALAREIGMLPRTGSPAGRAMLMAFNGLTWLRTRGGRRLRGAGGG